VTAVQPAGSNLSIITRHPLQAVIDELRPRPADEVLDAANKAVDHLPNPIGRGLHQPGDHLDGVASGRGQHHHGPPIADHVDLALTSTSTHDPL